VGAALTALKTKPLQIADQIGQRFLKSEGYLEQLTQASETLVSESEALVELATGQAEGRATVEETLELLKKPLEYLDRWRTGMELHIAELESASRVLGQLRNSEAILQATVRPLVFTQTMFRTESARLPAASRDVFSSLSAEIDSVQSRVRDTFSERFRLVASTQKSIDDVISGVRAQAGQLKQALITTTEQMTESVNTLLVEINRNATRDVQLEHTSQAIASEVGRIIVGLQTHDIVSQRLAHASTAIGEAGEILGGRASDSPEISGELRRVYTSLQVQAAQIVEVARMLNSTEATLQDAARTVLERIEVLDKECLLLQEFKQVSAAADGTIQVLLEMIDDVRRLTGTALRVADDSRRQLEPIGTLASGLTGSVQQLSHEMRLIALNVEIQAVHIGEGTGLEVLAAHTSGVSFTTSCFAENLSADLKRLGGEISATVRSLESLTDNGHAQMKVLTETGSVQELKLHRRRDGIFLKLNHVGESSDLIRSIMASFSAEAAVRAVNQHLEGLEAKLALASAEILKIAPELSQAPADLAIQSGYTMTGERDVYNTVMVRLSGKSELDSAPPSDEVRPENTATVELF